MKKVKAVCLETHPDTYDMARWAQGEINADEVKIYHKGIRYHVNPHAYNEEYFKIPD